MQKKQFQSDKELSVDIYCCIFSYFIAKETHILHQIFNVYFYIFIFYFKYLVKAIFISELKINYKFSNCIINLCCFLHKTLAWNFLILFLSSTSLTLTVFLESFSDFSFQYSEKKNYSYVLRLWIPTWNLSFKLFFFLSSKNFLDSSSTLSSQQSKNYSILN